MHRIDLDSEKLNPPQPEAGSSTSIQVMMSAYDVPDSINGEINETTGRFEIKLKYLTEDEPMLIKRANKHLYLRIGKNSGRLYGIEIDIQGLKSHSINLSIIPKKLENAIDELLIENKEPRFKSRLDNYRLAKRVIRENRDALLGDLLPSHP